MRSPLRFVRTDEMTSEQPTISPGMTESEIGTLKKRSVHASGTTLTAQGARFFIKLTAQILIAHFYFPPIMRSSRWSHRSCRSAI